MQDGRAKECKMAEQNSNKKCAVVEQNKARYRAKNLCQATISPPPTRSNGQSCTPDHQASRLASKHHLGMLGGTRGQGAFLNRHHVFSLFWLVNEFSGRSVHSDMSKCIANNPLCAQGWRIKSSCICLQVPAPSLQTRPILLPETKAGQKFSRRARQTSSWDSY